MRSFDFVNEVKTRFYELTSQLFQNILIKASSINLVFLMQRQKKLKQHFLLRIASYLKQVILYKKE